MRDLAAEYLNETPELLAFFAHPPHALRRSVPTAGPWAPQLAEALEEYQACLGNAPAFAGNEAVIITGQQPGLFTGPLYTIYKAVTAVILARKLSEQTGRPCLPVFWCGSEDHDFEEAQSAHFLTKSDEPLTLTYEPTATVDDTPMYHVPVEASLHGLIDRAAAETRGSEFRQEVAATLHEALDAADSLSDWCARLLARLFRNTPLVIFSPHLPAARAAAAPIIEQEILDPLASTRLLNETGDRLAAMGFPKQVAKDPDACSFFLEVDAKRRRVLFSGNRFELPDTGASFTADELLALLDSSPEQFSPNVALRCIVQQHLFPTTAYVAGPGELAYWAQLKPLFERFQLAMPVVYPRARCTLTSTKLNKLRARLGLDLDDLAAPFDELLEVVLRHTTTSPALAHVQAHRPRIEDAVQALQKDLAKARPAWADMAEGIRQKLASELDRLERAIVHGDKARIEATRSQVLRLSHALAPWRKPQERVYTVFSFLFEQGWDLIPRLIESLDVGSFTMNEIEL